MRYYAHTRARAARPSGMVHAQAGPLSTCKERKRLHLGRTDGQVRASHPTDNSLRTCACSSPRPPHALCMTTPDGTTMGQPSPLVASAAICA